MVTDARIEFRPNPLRQGSRSRRGTQVDREFAYRVLALLGDARALWLPGKSGTTLTDRSRSARVLTWSEDASAFDTPPAELGSGYAVTFNGVDEEGDTPDAADLSFGDGARDRPFTVAALVNLADATSSVVVSKDDSTTGVTKREWRLLLDAGDRPTLRLIDESTGGYIGRQDQTALAQGAWTLLAAVYDGSGACTGIRLYRDAERVDDADDSSGAYTAMENTSAVVAVGYRTGAAAKTDYFDGRLALVALAGRGLSHEEVWALKEVCNGYFGLSL